MFSSLLGGGNNRCNDPLSEVIEAPSGSSQSLYNADDQSQSMLNSPEWEDEEDDDLYTINSEVELIYIWQRTNKMAFGYLIPMAAALIAILLFKADSHEYAPPLLG